jgi:hypothetical protein
LHIGLVWATGGGIRAPAAAPTNLMQILHSH